MAITSLPGPSQTTKTPKHRDGGRVLGFDDGFVEAPAITASVQASMEWTLFPIGIPQNLRKGYGLI
jgi:hypothetical protein